MYQSHGINFKDAEEAAEHWFAEATARHNAVLKADADLAVLKEQIGRATTELDKLAVPAGTVPERIRKLWDYIHHAEKVIQASHKFVTTFRSGGDVVGTQLTLRDLLDEMEAGRKKWKWTHDDETN